MLDIFPFQKGYWYPHMSEADKAIWERFIEMHPDAYNSCQYDYHVGNPPPFNTLMDDGEDLNQDKLYRLRIDVLGHSRGNVDVIEIKPNAGASTIGQVKSYRTLFTRDEPQKGRVGMVIITDKLQNNMEYLCKAEGVKIIVV